MQLDGAYANERFTGESDIAVCPGPEEPESEPESEPNWLAFYAACRERRLSVLLSTWQATRCAYFCWRYGL